MTVDLAGPQTLALGLPAPTSFVLQLPCASVTTPSYLPPVVKCQVAAGSRFPSRELTGVLSV